MAAVVVMEAVDTEAVDTVEDSQVWAMVAVEVHMPVVALHALVMQWLDLDLL